MTSYDLRSRLDVPGPRAGCGAAGTRSDKLARGQSLKGES